MKIVPYENLPWNLQSVIDRIQADMNVYGFELELLADYVS